MVEVDSDISWISGVIFRKIDMCIVNESLHKIKHCLSGNCFKKIPSRGGGGTWSELDHVLAIMGPE